MTIFKTAYETTACKDYQISKVQHELKRLSAVGYIQPAAIPSKGFKGNSNYLMLVADQDSLIVPAFMHPLEVDDLMQSKGPCMVVDVRSATKQSQNRSDPLISNDTEYNFIVARGALSHYWIKENPEVVLNTSKLPASVYAQWLSMSITRRFGLDPNDQLTIAVVASYFYHTLFYKNEDVTSMLKQRMAVSIGRTVSLGVEKVLEIISLIEPIGNVAELCTAIQEATGNIRLNDLNVGLMVAVVGGSWYGLNAAELMAVALEHPPTWMTVVMSAISDRSFKNTVIGKLVAHNKSHDNEAYAHAFHNILALSFGN